MSEEQQIRLAPGEYERVDYVVMSQEKLEELDYSLCRCVFTITTGRSGTDWLTHFLNHFEGIKAVHEPYPSMFEVNRHRAEGLIKAREAAYTVRQMRSHFVRNCYHHGITYAEISPFMAHLVVPTKMAFKGARFIHLVRGPRAFVKSALPRAWYQYPTIQSHWWPKNHPPNLDQTQRLIWWWNEVHSRGLTAEKKYGAQGCFRLRAEDMWTKPEPLKDLARWALVPEIEVDRCDGFISQSQERPRNVSQQKRAEWDPAYEPFLKEVAGDTMEALGYD